MCTPNLLSLSVALALLVGCTGGLDPVPTDPVVPETDTDTDTDSDSDADADADADADSDADADADSDADSDSDTDADTDINCIDDNANEPNDDFVEALPMAAGYYVTSSISQDVWELSVPAEADLTVRIQWSNTGVFGAPGLFLTDPANIALGTLSSGTFPPDDPAYPDGGYEEFAFTNEFDAPRTVFAEVTAETGPCVNYNFTYNLVVPPPCVADAYEPNDDRAAATFPPLPAELTLEATNTEDWIDFTVEAGATVDVRADFLNDDGNIDMYVYPKVGSILLPPQQTFNDGEVFTVTNADTVPATYTARLTLSNPASSDPCVRYTFSVVPSIP